MSDKEPPPARSHAEDLRGVSRLAVDATRGITDLVQAMQVTIAGGPAVLGRPLEGPVRLITDLVYGGIRGITDLVGSGIEQGLLQLAPLLGESVPGAEREAVLAALNGVLGDFLEDTKNPLAIAMSFRSGGRALRLESQALQAAFPAARGHVVVAIHGSCMNDLQWCLDGEHDFAAGVADVVGGSVVYLHHNSGLHISTNGQRSSALLAQLVAQWPVPVTAITLLGHSMGGLVARSACHAAEVAGHAWRGLVKNLVCLGTPHHGAPLERGGNWIDVLLGVSRYSAPFARLGQIRSAGVTDLRFGNVLDVDWQGSDRFSKDGDQRHPLPLPAGVACFAVAATMSAAASASSAVEDLRGDGLVPVESALGRHADPRHALAFAEDHCAVVYGAGHLDLLRRESVLTTLSQWLATPNR